MSAVHNNLVPVSKDQWKPSFYAFSASQGLAQFAAQGLLTALPLIVIVDLNASASFAGLLAAAQYLPVLLITPILGTLVDSWSKRPVMVVVHLARAVIFAVLAGVAAAGGLNLGLLIACVFLSGAFSACFDVAVQAYLPAVVPSAALLNSNALVQGVQAMAQVLGPAVGGVVAGFGHPAAGFLVFALLYLISGSMLLGARQPEDRTARSSGSIWRRTVDGFRICMRHPKLRIFLFAGAWFNLFERAMLTIYLVFAVTQLGLSTWQIGLTTALGALGAVCGALLSRRSRTSKHRLTLLIGAMGFASVAPLGLVFVPNDGISTVVVASVIFFAYGSGLTVYNVQAVSLRQMLAPMEFQGRVAGVYRFFAYGAIGVGGLLAAGLLRVANPQQGLAVVTALLVVGWVVFGVMMIRHRIATLESQGPA